MLSPQQRPEKSNILIVDDSQSNARILSAILEHQGYAVRSASSGLTALDLVEASPPDLILLDILMPEMDGYAVCKRLKATHKTSDIPVIFMSALEDSADKVLGFAEGGIDYITKPFEVEEVLARVETHLALHDLQHHLESQNGQLQQEVIERTAALTRANAALKAEIAERKQAEAALEERIRFETLLTDLSAALVTLSTAHAEASIVQGLQHVISFLAIDRCTLIEFSDDKTELFTTHSEIAEGIPPMRRDHAFSEEFPWLVAKLLRNEIIVLTDVPDDLPEVARQEREYCARDGIQSGFVIPLAASGSVLGALLFCRFHHKRTWPEVLVRRLRIVGEIFANALVRKRMEAQLRAHTQHLETLVDGKVRELELARAKTIQSAKLASMGEMANGVAHEMNQPLTAMLFEAEYLKAIAQQSIDVGKRTCSLDAKELYHIGDNLAQDIERSRRVTDYLRTFSDIGKGDVVRTHINNVIENSFTLTAARLRQHGVNIERRMCADLPPIHANPHKLEQVFANLISNAEYALEEMARRVAAGEVERDGYRKTLTISTHVENESVVAEVYDNGCGIPQTAKPHIFEPFFTTKPVGKGSGLGLSTCQGYVTESGGQITFESEENKGTTFTLRFPVVASKPVTETVNSVA